METKETESVTVQDHVNKPMMAQEAADFLGFSKGYLYKLVSAKKIACFQPGGKILYFRRNDLENYAYRNRIASRDELREKADAILNGMR
jgi:excisionase family DNA binding protein